jgi:hypothetical protein
MSNPVAIRNSERALSLVSNRHGSRTGVPALPDSRGFLPALLLLIVLSCLTAAAASSSAAYTIPHSALDGGGARARSANYTMDASFGGVGGFSTATTAGIVSQSGFVGQLNDPPAVADALFTVAAGSSVAVPLNVTDADHDPLTFRIISGPTHGTLVGTIPNQSYNPGPNYTTGDQFTFAASDGFYDSAPTTITLVAPSAIANTPPTLDSVPDQSVNEGLALAVQLHASDTDSPPQQLTFSLDAGAPAGAQLDVITGLFTWTPSEAQGPGDYPFTVRVFDNGVPAYSAIRQFHVTVGEVNAAPSLAPIPNRTATPGVALAFQASASDSDLPAQQLVFSLDPGAPAGAAVTAGGLFSWTPGLDVAGRQFNVTMTVTDNGSPALTAKQSFTISVETMPPPPAPNTAPVLAVIADKIVKPGATLTFTATATDAEMPPQKLTFSLGAGAPAGATISAITGVFTWTAGAAQTPGEFPVTIVVADNGVPSLSASRQFRLFVPTPNTPPLFAFIADKTVAEGTALSFSVLAGDRDFPPQKLSYTLDPGAPPGAALNPETLIFSWTPTEGQGPGNYRITVRVTDNGDPPMSGTTTFTVTVTELNTPPVLSTIPDQTVRAGEPLVFIASARDADLPVQTLTFSLVAAPTGAVIDPATGRFTWTPAPTHPGGVEDIQIAVSDNGVPQAGATAKIRITILPTEKQVEPPVVISGDEVEMVFHGKPNACYRVETSPDLKKWIDGASGQADGNGRFTVSDSFDAAATLKLYRLVEVSCDTTPPPVKTEWKDAVELSDGKVRFTLRAPPNSCFAVEMTTDLISWTRFSTHSTDSTGSLSFTTATDSASGRGIFRVRKIDCATP